MELLLLVFLSGVVFIIYYYFRVVNTPYIEKSNRVDSFVINALERSRHIVLKKYYPFIFWSSHIQIMALVLKTRLNLNYRLKWKPEIFKLNDGQKVRLFWYNPNSEKESCSAPLVIITGGIVSQSVNNSLEIELAMAWGNRGFRVLVFERRGHSKDIQLILPKYSLLGSSDDVYQVFKYANKKYSPSFIIAVGISSGVAPMTLFLNKAIINNYKLASNILCGIGIAPMYNLNGFSKIPAFYSNDLLSKLKSMVRFSHKNLIEAKKINLKKVKEVLKATDLSVFFNKTINLMSNSYNDYIKSHSPILPIYFKKKYSHIPILLFNTSDDPFCRKRDYHQNEKNIKNRNNTLFFFSKYGGHASSLNLKMRIDIISRIIAFTDAIEETKKTHKI